MRIGRWIIGIVAGCILLAACAVIVVTVFVDPNRFKGQIEAAVHNATGRSFKIEGDLDIVWFPWLGVRMGPAQLSNLPGASGTALAQWQSARIEARLLPLMRGHLIIGRVRLDRPTLRLERAIDGHANWDDLLVAFKRLGGSAGGPEIRGVEIRDGTLEYNDEESGSTFALSPWQLDVGAWQAGAEAPVQTQLRFRTHNAAQQHREAELRLSARLRTSVDMKHIELAAVELSGRLLGDSLPAAGVPIGLNMLRAVAQLSPARLSIPTLSVRIANAQITGSVQADAEGPAQSLRAHGPVSLQIPSVRSLLPALGITASLPLDRTTLGGLTLTGAWTWTAGALMIEPVDVHIDATRFAGRVARSNAVRPVWTFEFHGDRIDLTRYVSLEDTHKPPFELPVAALRALRAEGQVSIDEARLASAQMKSVRFRLELEDGAVKNNASE